MSSFNDPTPTLLHESFLISKSVRFYVVIKKFHIKANYFLGFCVGGRINKYKENQINKPCKGTYNYKVQILHLNTWMRKSEEQSVTSYFQHISSFCILHCHIVFHSKMNSICTQNINRFIFMSYRCLVIRIYCQVYKIEIMTYLNSLDNNNKKRLKTGSSYYYF